jgi:hypothetical protein
MSNIFEPLLISYLGDKPVLAYYKDKPANDDIKSQLIYCISFIRCLLMMLNVSGQCYMLLASWCAVECGCILKDCKPDEKESLLDDTIQLPTDIHAIVHAWLS